MAVSKLSLPEPMRSYCQLDLSEKNSVKFEVKYVFFLKKMLLKTFLQNFQPFCSDLNVVITTRESGGHCKTHMSS